MNYTLYLDKKITIFESDDWGMLEIRDLEAFERLKRSWYNVQKRKIWTAM
jgi:hypothetical protein